MILYDFYKILFPKQSRQVKKGFLLVLYRLLTWNSILAAVVGSRPPLTFRQKTNEKWSKNTRFFMFFTKNGQTTQGFSMILSSNVEKHNVFQ